MKIKNSKPINPSTHLPIHSLTHSPISSFTHFLLPSSSFLIPIFFFLLPFLSGCATKTTPVFVTIKSPQIKLSDEGFLKESMGYKELVIYKAGNVPIKFILKDNKVCVNNECFNKYMFVKKYFSGYKKDFFDKILSKKPLSLKSIKKTNDGFIQKSKDIIYIVKKNSVLFKDKVKKIIIFIKYLKEKG